MKTLLFIFYFILCASFLLSCSKTKDSSLFDTNTARKESESNSDSFQDEIPNYTFMDDTGSSVTVPKKPQNTAVLFSSYADIWIQSGGQVAVTVEESVERGYVQTENVILAGQGSGKEINAEVLIASNPDFVILTTDFPGHQDLAPLLRESGIPVALFQVDNFEQYLNVLKIFTDINETPDRYQTYGLDVKKRIDTILESVTSSNASMEEKPSVLLIRAYSTGAKAKTTDHFVGQMLDELHTDNIATHAEILLEELSMEAILAEDPDFIFITTMGQDVDAAKEYMQHTMDENPAWKELRAIKQNHYIFLPKDLFLYKPNAHWDEAYEYLAKLLYPDL